MNIAEALKFGDVRLADVGIAEHRLEASSLLTFALRRERSFLIAHPEYDLTSDEDASYRNVIARREGREPFQYIVGRQEFYGFDFEVNPNVLIPRPETELLVERAIVELSSIDSPEFCEIGVGSGCISVAILKHVPTARATGVDISETALEVAARNALLNGVENRLMLRASDVFSELGDKAFDAVVSNPPYIPESEFVDLQPEVRDFEPASALTDGGSGLSIIRRIIDETPARLVAGGILIVEIGFGQAESVRLMLRDDVWRSAEFLLDLQLIERTLVAVKH